MLKRLCVAIVSAIATITPVSAEVQDGTHQLLQTLDDNGVLVTYNHPECASNGAFGQYRWVGMAREIRLCPGDTVDALDHNVVRHEVIHAIQHCVNVARGTNYDTPVITNEAEFTNFITENLTRREIDSITDEYPRDQWPTELEAFAGANAYTATELEEMFLDVCVAPETGIS